MGVFGLRFCIFGRKLIFDERMVFWQLFYRQKFRVCIPLIPYHKAIAPCSYIMPLYITYTQSLVAAVQYSCIVCIYMLIVLFDYFREVGMSTYKVIYLFET